MTDDIAILKKNILGLSQKAASGYSTHTSFFSLGERDIAMRVRTPLPPLVYGGYDNAERAVLFYGEIDSQAITCIKIEATMPKYAGELTHRDCLGSIIGCGIDRKLIGDILIYQNIAYVYCLNSITEYIISELTRVGHTVVKCMIVDAPPVDIIKLPDISEVVTASERCDCIISAVYHISRSESLNLFTDKRVFFNGLLCESPSKSPSEGDIVSVRGTGRFVYEGVMRETSKGHKRIGVRIYGK